jgi:hypothetical protein
MNSADGTKHLWPLLHFVDYSIFADAIIRWSLSLAGKYRLTHWGYDQCVVGSRRDVPNSLRGWPLAAR